MKLVVYTAITEADGRRFLKTEQCFLSQHKTTCVKCNGWSVHLATFVFKDNGFLTDHNIILGLGKEDVIRKGLLMASHVNGESIL